MACLQHNTPHPHDQNQARAGVKHGAAFLVRLRFVHMIVVVVVLVLVVVVVAVVASLEASLCVCH